MTRPFPSFVLDSSNSQRTPLGKRAGLGRLGAGRVRYGTPPVLASRAALLETILSILQEFCMASLRRVTYDS